ncbi:MAG: Calx-beta domain-containing protein [Planctomycetota bacterium]
MLNSKSPRRRRARIELLEKRQLLASDVFGTETDFEVVANSNRVQDFTTAASFETFAANTAQTNDLGTLLTDTTATGSFQLNTSRRYLGFNRTVGRQLISFTTNASQSFGWQLTIDGGTSPFALGYTLRGADGTVYGVGSTSSAGENTVEGYVFNLPAGRYTMEVDGGTPQVLAIDRVTNYSLTLRPNQVQPPTINESEDNDEASEANELGLLGARVVRGSITHQTVRRDGRLVREIDPDTFRFSIPRDGQLQVELTGVFSVSDATVFADVRDRDWNLVRKVEVNGSNPNQTVDLQDLGLGDYFLFVSSSNARGEMDYSVRLQGPPPETPIPGAEIESNDSLETANYLGALTGPLIARGQLDYQFDQGDPEIRIPESDFFRFEVVETSEFRFQGGVDFDVHDIEVALLNADGVELTVLDFESRLFNQRFDQSSLPLGTYYLHVRGRTNDSGINLRPNYSISISPVAIPAPQQIDGREIEPNDSYTQANDLGVLESTLTVDGRISFQDRQGAIKLGEDAKFGNPDYFSFVVDGELTSEVTVGLLLEQAFFPVNVQVVDAEGTGVREFSLTNILANRRTVELEPGAYFVVLTTPPLGDQPARNVDYTLNLSREAIVPLEADRLEPNNSAALASELPAGDLSEVNLHDPNDRDLYRFVLETPGQASDEVTLRFDGTDMDLDLLISNESELPVGISDGTASRERVSLSGFPAGTYFVEVYSPNQSTGEYSLSLDVTTSPATPNLAEDAYEDNDSFGKSYDLLGIEGRYRLTNLTLDVNDGVDRDFFQFTIMGEATASNFIELSASPAGAPRQMQLYDANRSLLDSDSRRVSLAGLQAGSYYVGIESQQNAEIEYQLDFFAPVRSNEFSINVDIQADGLSQEVINVVEAAVARWEQVVTSDLPDFIMPDFSPEFMAGAREAFGPETSFPSGNLIDDLYVAVFISDIDGPGGILAGAAAFGARHDGTATMGFVQYDQADLLNDIRDGSAVDTMFHEIGHILQDPHSWDRRGLRRPTIETTGIGFFGERAIEEFNTLEPTNHVFASVPLMNQGGPGTACGHLSEAVFGDEIMTGYATAPGVKAPLSRVTLAMLQDLGYAIDYAQADAFEISAVSTATATPFVCPTHSDGNNLIELEFEDLALLAEPAQIIAAPLEQLFQNPNTLKFDLAKSQSAPQVRSILAGESQLYELTLEGRGTVRNGFRVESVIDRPLEIELQDADGTTLSSGLASNREVVSLAGYPAGDYRVRVYSAEDNRYVPPVFIDVDALEPATSVLDVDGDGSYNSITDPLLIDLVNRGFSDAVIESFAQSDTRDAAEIRNYVLSLADSIDIDGDGGFNSITDNLLIDLTRRGFSNAVLDFFSAPNASRDSNSVRDRVDGLLSNQKVASTSLIAASSLSESSLSLNRRVQGESVSPQQVLTLSGPDSAAVAEEFSVVVDYATINSAMEAAGLSSKGIGFSLFFDSDTFTPNFDNSSFGASEFVVTNGLEIAKQFGEANPEGGQNIDNVDETDSFVFVKWSDPAIPTTFPNGNQPSELLRLSGSASADTVFSIVVFPEDSDQEFMQVVSGTPLTVSVNPVDNVAPNVTSIRRDTPAVETTSEDTVEFLVTFSEDVQNADVTDIRVIGTTATASVIQRSASSYGVVVSGGDLADLNGTVAIELSSENDIIDDSNNALSNSPPVLSETYTLENIPTVKATLAISLDDSTLDEGDDGLTEFEVNIARDGDTSSAVTVNLVVAGAGENSANADDFADGVLPQFPIAFEPGETSKFIAVQVRGDTTVENDENFTVTLSNASAGAEIITPSVLATIRNDDQPRIDPVVFSISAEQLERNEGDSGLREFGFPVSRTGDASQAASIGFQISGDVEASDIQGGVLSGTLNFAAGSSTANLTVNVIGDSVNEQDETLTVTLVSPPEGATIGTASASSTVLNDDIELPDPIIFNIAAQDQQKPEGNSGTTPFVFNVSRTGDTTSGATIDYQVSGDVDGSDFLDGMLAGTVNLNVGESTATITIDVLGDLLFEADETLTVSLLNQPAGSSINEGSASSIVRNDDPRPVANYSIAARAGADRDEGDSGLTSFSFEVTRMGDTTVESSVEFQVVGSGDDASDADDFGGAFPSGTVSFAIGETSKPLSVLVSADSQVEADEQFTVKLGNASGDGVITQESAIGVIRDDDGTGTETRILSPANFSSLVAIPGDSIPTAYIFQAVADTSISVVPVGVGVVGEVIQIVDQSLQQISSNVEGTATADLQAGTLNAIIFLPQTQDRIYSIRSSNGFESLANSITTNFFEPTDTNGDGSTSALDALVVINSLTRSEQAGEGAFAASEDWGMYDVNADGRVSAVDALRVINHLNRQGSTHGGQRQSIRAAGESPLAPATSRRSLERAQDAEPLRDPAPKSTLETAVIGSANDSRARFANSNLSVESDLNVGSEQVGQWDAGAVDDALVLLAEELLSK